MTDLDALLAGIVAHPHEHVRWLIVADWLDDHGQPDRAELLRLHRMMIDTCCEPDQHPERATWHTQMMELMRAGTKPCLPQHTLMLPGGVPLIGSFIPPGSFLMGSPESEVDHQPDEQSHLVNLTQGFYMGVAPVTQAQWVAVMGHNPSQFKGERLPVETVSWNEARAYCEAVKVRLGVETRLPTEAEWEYAARAGTTTSFYWGNELNGTQANCDGRCPYGTAVQGSFSGRTTPVGQYSAKAPHPWGLVDVIGNVFEWCADWYDESFSSRSPATDPVCQDGARTYRSGRGASWEHFPGLNRVAGRYWLEPDLRYEFNGFRVAFTLT